MSRNLTNGEVKLLKPVFLNTLNYYSIVCDVNMANVGGVDNSITPAGVVHFSRNKYCPDFSGVESRKWLFVHEIVHVWQWGHGVYPVWAAIGAWFENGGDYLKAYNYDLKPGKSLRDYNLEQQASIVADYWALQYGNELPRDNNNFNASVADYKDVIDELQKSGPPVSTLDAMPR
jgi:hypothetical protein